MAQARQVKIVYKPTGTVLAEGPIGWGVTRFEGNFYCQAKYINRGLFRVNYIPGICVYKFLYTWVDLVIEDKVVSKNLSWLYWLPNPLIPFIWFRIAIPGGHPELDYFLSDL